MATWAAPHSAKPHSVPDLCDPLNEGPHVALVLTRVNGYAAECERTYFTAPPSPEIRKAFETMRQARRIAFDKVRPGVACSELDCAVNDFLRQEGYSGEEVRLHRTGHGFGLGNHEAPWVAEGSLDILSENMVISIEPGIYLEGIGGLRHSDTVLVTKDGCELLTHFPDGYWIADGNGVETVSTHQGVVRTASVQIRSEGQSIGVTVRLIRIGRGFPERGRLPAANSGISCGRSRASLPTGRRRGRGHWGARLPRR